VKQSLSLLIPLFCLTFVDSISPNSVLAQVTPDGTTSTTVDANGNNFEINDGDRAGDNLFHSFRDFSVPNGGDAFFNNANDIVNIFSRVTGGNISNIDGFIRANGSANLFLINPAEIIFGENASLDIGGSFYGSSADSILFEDGEFSATDLENPPLLTINAPIGLSLRDEPGDISVRNNAAVTIQAGSDLAIIGGNIFLLESVLSLSGGQITIGGLASKGIVQINEDGSLSFPNDVPLADVLITENSQLGVETSQGGSISINAENLELSQNSFIFADVTGESAGNQLESGNIEILANNIDLRDNSAIQVFTFDEGDTANVLIDANSIFLDSSQIISGVGEGGLGNSGDVTINTNSLVLTNGSRIETLSFGQGNSGDIQINADDGIFFDGDMNMNFNGFSSGIATSLREGGVGNSGDIQINARSLFLQNGGFIFAGVSGRGNAGDIDVTALDIIIDGINDEGFSAGIFSQIFEGGEGNGGNININAGSISLTNGGQIDSSTDGIGNSGNISINVNDAIAIDGVNNDGFSAGVFSRVFVRGEGDGGNININAGSISLTNGGQIDSSTDGIGNSGNISINVNDAIAIDGVNNDGFSAGIFSRVSPNGFGSAGNIDLTTNSLTVADGGSINAGTFGEGSGGNIAISAENINVSGNSQDEFFSGIFANSGVDASGDAGNISITTENLSIANGATITVDSQGSGNGGDVSISANSLELDNNASISATTTSGFGGDTDIFISDRLTLRNNSKITAGAFGDADGGNVSLSAEFIIAFPSKGDGNDIIAEAELGQGGSIFINTGAFFNIAIRPAVPGNGTNDISAGSQEEVLDLSSQFNVDLRNIPQLITSDQTIEDVCSANPDTGKPNGLTVRGRGGLPATPFEPLDADNIIVNGEVVAANQLDIKPIKTSHGDIYPARGVIVKENGDVILTAYPTDNVATRTPTPKKNCRYSVSD
jgi:filamentous hemagglutinin family protein